MAHLQLYFPSKVVSRANFTNSTTNGSSTSTGRRLQGITRHADAVDLYPRHVPLHNSINGNPEASRRQRRRAAEEAAPRDPLDTHRRYMRTLIAAHDARERALQEQLERAASGVGTTDTQSSLALKVQVVNTPSASPRLARGSPPLRRSMRVVSNAYPLGSSHQQGIDSVDSVFNEGCGSVETVDTPWHLKALAPQWSVLPVDHAPRETAYSAAAAAAAVGEPGWVAAGDGPLPPRPFVRVRQVVMLRPRADGTALRRPLAIAQVVDGGDTQALLHSLPTTPHTTHTTTMPHRRTLRESQRYTAVISDQGDLGPHYTDLHDLSQSAADLSFSDDNEGMQISDHVDTPEVQDILHGVDAHMMHDVSKEALHGSLVHQILAMHGAAGAGGRSGGRGLRASDDPAAAAAAAAVLAPVAARLTAVRRVLQASLAPGAATSGSAASIAAALGAAGSRVQSITNATVNPTQIILSSLTSLSTSMTRTSASLATNLNRVATNMNTTHTQVRSVPSHSTQTQSRTHTHTHTHTRRQREILCIQAETGTV